MYLWFVSIEMYTTKKAKAKTSSKTTAILNDDERLNICNEIKIITADGTTFRLYSGIIFSHSTRELIDSDTMKKFKDITDEKFEKDE